MPSVLAYGVGLAAATSSKKSSGSSTVFLFLLIALVVVVYFFVLRPRSQRQRQAREQLRAAKVGDEVATIGGLVGTIVAEDGDRVTISTGSGTELVFLRQAIGRRLSPDDAVVAPPDDAAHVDEEFQGQPPGFDGSHTDGASAAGDEPEKK